MDQIFITSAAISNYEGMYALIADDGRVYLGRDSNFYPETSGDAPACYDNSDGSLQLISDNVKMFHFLYGDGWPFSNSSRDLFIVFNLLLGKIKDRLPAVSGKRSR